MRVHIDKNQVQERSSHASLRYESQNQSSLCALLDREIPGVEVDVCTDIARMHTIYTECWVILCKDSRISIGKSLGHFVCRVPSFSRPSMRFQLAILEVLEEQF